ncbi:glycosyl hydrolase [Halobacillus andaensis]|uniref:Alpha-amylase n=1 Tax=Halobacillus andaensis TaxID=1176239 RepID=A0A917ETY9_HALAA|nr:alpha-amylase family glycosyl hydrolase [Halobacillus andaensis]MBP2004085.1 alpha-amylase [Halobacillus andaensis]GGF15684.1 glycosyl hydrolase [Halobacillus andaensis]
MRKFATILMLIPFLLFCAHNSHAAEKEERKWQDESMYFIMVDRFMNGDKENDYEVDTDDPAAYHGGDLQGIIDQLDYIEELGFTSIWLTPIMENEEKGYHGYWIEDFMEVEEHFGTMEDAKKLVEEAHDRDIKVIFDFVVNHTGSQHSWLDDEEKDDWFHEEQSIMGDDQQRLEDGWLSGLPDLNTENPEVKQYLFDAAEFWIEETGVDGFRLDTVKHVPKEFWSEFNDHVKSVDEDFFLLGEVWSDDPTYIADYESTGIDSFVDYPYYNAATETFKASDGSLTSLSNVWQRNKEYYEEPYLLGNFIDNHDNKRFTRVAGKENENPVTRWKLALTHMFTAPGFPITYYGSEVPLDGGEDPDNRKMMNFKGGDEQLEQRIEKLNSMRDEFPALTRGDYEELYNEDGMSVYKREFEDEIMVIAINNASGTRSTDLTDLPDDHQMRGLLEDGVVRQSNDGVYKLGMARETSDVFVVEEDQGFNWLFIGFVGGILLLFVIAVVWISLKNKRGA